MLVPLIALTPTAANAVPSYDTCAATVVIGVRGTDEPSGLGRTAAVVTKIQRDFRQTVRTDYLDSTEYPATAVNYPTSVRTGVLNLRGKLGRLVNLCGARTNIVLVGYSQGANVIGDVLDIRNTQLSSTVGNRIKAVILLGDPTFRANQNYSAGTYDTTRSGVFRRDSGDFGIYASRIRSYCNRLDYWCQNPLRGETLASAHADYDKYADQAFAFARSRYQS